MIGALLHWTAIAAAGPLTPAWFPLQEPVPAAIARDGATSEGPEAIEWQRREAELLLRIGGLERELREAQQSSLQRQEEWLEYMRVLQSFALPSLPDPPDFIADALREPPDPLAEMAAREALQLAARAEEMLSQLDALMAVDGIRSIDILEIGRLHQHEGRGFTGPLVARLVDGRSRVIGMLRAERMRLEVSRASRSVTLVLEDGYEMRGGQERPFLGEQRRIFMGTVEPLPWIETFPELLDDNSLAPVIDDGLWDVADVRVRMSRLLADAARAGDAAWQLAALGGIRDGELRDVQLVERTRVAVPGQPGSRPAASGAGYGRRIFADVGRVRASDGGRGIEIELSLGTVDRDGRVAPFLDGRYRLVLPFADADAWRAAAIPGLGVPQADRGE